MIKIIEHGTRKIAKCSVCGCVFSYEEEDVQIFTIRHVKCPQCNEAVTVIAERGCI